MVKLPGLSVSRYSESLWYDIFIKWASSSEYFPFFILPGFPPGTGRDEDQEFESKENEGGDPVKEDDELKREEDDNIIKEDKAGEKEGGDEDDGLEREGFVLGHPLVEDLGRGHHEAVHDEEGGEPEGSRAEMTND